jgi:hypothetical protein
MVPIGLMDLEENATAQKDCVESLETIPFQFPQNQSC